MNVSTLPLSCAVYAGPCGDTRSTTVPGLGDGWPILLVVALICGAVVAVALFICRRKRR